VRATDQDIDYIAIEVHFRLACCCIGGAVAAWQQGESWH
jgi:hypothetical protein